MCYFLFPLSLSLDFLFHVIVCIIMRMELQTNKKRQHRGLGFDEKSFKVSSLLLRYFPCVVVAAAADVVVLSL